MCMSECLLTHLWIVCVCVQWCWRPEESVRSSGARVTGGCELTDVGAVSWTQVFYKSSLQLLLELKAFIMIESKAIWKIMKLVNTSLPWKWVYLYTFFYIY